MQSSVMDTQLIADWLTEIQTLAQQCQERTVGEQKKYTYLAMRLDLERIRKLALRVGDEAGVEVRV